MRSFLYLSAMLAATTGAAVAQDATLPAPATLQVFKNGFAVVTYELRPGTDMFQTMLPGRARHGTVWFTCQRDDSCVTTIHSPATDFDTPPTTLPNAKALLPLAQGSVQLVMDEDRTVEGTVQAVYTNQGKAPPGQPAEGTVQVVVLKDAAGRSTAVEAGLIRRIQFSTSPALPDYPAPPKFRDSNQPLTVTVKKGLGKDPVTLHTLEYGYTWAPTYKLDFQSEDRAALQMKATLFNEGAALKDTRVALAAGWANLAFSSNRPALHTAVGLSEFLRDMGGEPQYPRESNMVMQRMSNVAAPSFDQDAYANYVPPTPGAEAVRREDLHLYDGGAVTMAAGDRFTRTLFAETVKKEHLYEWTVPDISGRGANNEAPKFLLHKVRLTNATKAPWTTAPVEITKDGAVIAQSVINYTPAGGVGEVEVSRALDFALKAEDTVNHEAAQHVTVANRSRMKIPGEGSLTLKSLKEKPVKVVVKKTIIGTVAKTTPDAKVTEQAPDYSYDNPQTLITWERTVKPGEEVTFSYTYTKLQN